ncbi:MAG: DUF1684 domain-containing protein [Chloroflexota bacterium]
MDRLPRGSRLLTYEPNSQISPCFAYCLAQYPYCAYSPYFSCPLPPREHWLTVPIRAGEKKFK